MEASAVGECDDCYDVAENTLFGQIAAIGTGAFDVALDVDMLKDVIVDHHLPIQWLMSMPVDGGMTPGLVAMTAYNSLSARCGSRRRTSASRRASRRLQVTARMRQEGTRATSVSAKAHSARVACRPILIHTALQARARRMGCTAQQAHMFPRVRLAAPRVLSRALRAHTRQARSSTGRALVPRAQHIRRRVHGPTLRARDTRLRTRATARQVRLSAPRVRGAVRAARTTSARARALTMCRRDVCVRRTDLYG